MSYSVIGLLAVIIHLIVNSDIFLKQNNEDNSAIYDYRNFLYSVIAYHLSDAVWGLLYEHRLLLFLYMDTVVYFATMALSVLLWTIFAVRYLGQKNRFEGILINCGRLFFMFQLLALVLNLVAPILFYLDSNGEYHALFARYIAFAIQILMFMSTSVYMLFTATKTDGSKKRRHMTIGLFGIAMIFAVLAQIFFPLLPLYSIGYMLGGCVLHTYVVDDEKLEYIAALEEALGREAVQQEELGEAKKLAYTDSLTGVKSKHAYVEKQENLDSRIARGQISQLSMVVFDLNDLKSINDTSGHDVGDTSIIEASRMICDIFKHSPVYRVGGDEFVVLLEGHDFDDRFSLVVSFNKKTEENLRAGKVVVSAGMSDYAPGKDKRLSDLFSRADKVMYRRKNELKSNLKNIKKYH